MFKTSTFYRSVILLLLFASCDNIYRSTSTKNIEQLNKKQLVSADSSAALQKEKQQFNTEDYENIVENDFLLANENPLSTFSIDVDEAAYSNVRRFIQNGTMPPTPIRCFTMVVKWHLTMLNRALV